MLKSLSAGLFTLTLASGSGWSAMIMHTDTIPIQDTNWSLSFSIPKFDASLGTLNKITIELTGIVQGDTRFESLDGAPSTVHSELRAQINLLHPVTLAVLLGVLPAVIHDEAVTAFDGTADFAGGSGRTFPGESNSLATMVSTMDPGDLALFTGLGAILLGAEAIGTSTATGPGNLLVQFNTDAGAQLKVIYDFTPQGVIPEAGTGYLAAMGAVLILAGHYRRRRHSRRA